MKKVQIIYFIFFVFIAFTRINAIKINCEHMSGKSIELYNGVEHNRDQKAISEFDPYWRLLIKLKLNKSQILASKNDLRDVFYGNLGVLTYINGDKIIDLRIVKCSNPGLNTVTLQVYVTKDQKDQLGPTFGDDSNGDLFVSFEVKEENIKNKALLD